MADDEDVDVEALLASINANFEQPTEEQMQEQPENQEQTASDLITIVRQQAQEEEKEFDPIEDILYKIQLQNSLLTEKSIQEHQLDTSSLQEIVSIVKENFDFRQEVIFKNQKFIINKVNEVQRMTNKLLSQQQAKEYTVSKVKPSEVQSKLKDLSNLDLQVFKTKGYVLTIIERLEMMEGKMDQIIDYHVKKKLEMMEQKAKQQIDA